MVKRCISFLLAMVLLFAAATVALGEAPVYKIGICQLEQHAALKDATQGFTDAITQQLGTQVELNVKNAFGDSANCISIVNALLAEDVDLILANSTQALQAASSATSTTPILGVAVADYPVALDMDIWEDVTGINVSGTSDLAPLDAQAELIRTMFPGAKQIGLLYCASEVNSQYQVQTIREQLEPMGYTCTDYAFTDTNDLFSVAQSACQNSDVLFVPTDNTIATCTEAIRNVVEPEGVPVIAGEEGICSGCGVATLSISYYDLGCATGEMAYEILANGKDVSAMPIQFAPNVTKKYNAELCKILNVTIPEGYQAIE